MWSYFRTTDLFKNLAKTWLILPTNNRLQLLPKMKNESLKMWQVLGGLLSHLPPAPNQEMATKITKLFHTKMKHFYQTKVNI